jgi:two-component system LytT family response regulator
VVLVNKETLEVTRSLKEYEAQLCNKEWNFLRIHNSFIININYVSRYLKEDGGYAVIGDKKSIPVSKAKKDEFLRMINFRPKI